MMFGLFGGLMVVLWVPVVVALVTLGVVLVRRSVSAPEWMLRGSACGGCGYELSAIGEGRCSECGGSLVKVGVTTPRMAARIRGSGYLLVMGWTLIVVMVGMPVMGVVSWMSMTAQMNQNFGLGAARQGNLSGTITPNVSYTIDNQTGQIVEPDVNYAIRYSVSVVTDETSQAESGRFNLSFDEGVEPYQLSLDLADMSWELRDDEGGVVLDGIGVSTDDAVEIFSAVGLDTTDSDRQNEAVLFGQIIRDMKIDPLGIDQRSFNGFGNDSLNYSPSSSSWGSRNIAGPAISAWDYAGIAVVVVGGVVYIVGLVWFLRKRAKLLGRATPA